MTGADFYKCFTAILHSLLACIIPYLHSTFYMSPLFGHFIFAWTYGKSIYISVRLILSALAPERTKKLPLRPRVTGAHQYRLFYNSMVDNSHKIVDFKAGTAYETAIDVSRACQFSNITAFDAATIQDGNGISQVLFQSGLRSRTA